MKFILIFNLHKTALQPSYEFSTETWNSRSATNFGLVFPCESFSQQELTKNWMPVTDTKKKWCFHFTLPLTTDCTIFFVPFNYFHRRMRLCKIKYWQMWEKCIDNNKQETTEKLTFSQEKSVFTTTFILSPWLEHFFLLWELFAFLLPTWFMCYVK